MAVTRLSRELVYGRRGMVCSNSPLAASAGIKTMQDGGNAFDAALAVAAVEAVTLVRLGGDSFVLLYEASSRKVTGVNSSGVAASGLTTDCLAGQGYRTMPLEGPHAVSVPGEVAAWEEIHRRFCTREFQSLLDSAIGYAEEGFPVAPGLGRDFANRGANLSHFPASAAIYHRTGRVPTQGELLTNKDLARTLHRVAQGGSAEFYRGDLAREMVRGLNAAGGRFSDSDFTQHQAEVYDPISTSYRGHEVYQTQPPSQGFLLLEMLNLLEGFDLASLGQNSAQAIHLMVQAKGIAYNDRNRLAGDPKFVDWPLADLVSKSYAESRLGEISPATGSGARLQPVEADGDTTYFCVADGEGNCVSWVHSLSNAFGSCLVAEGTGVLFNNRAGRGFSLEPGHPNRIAPGKRTMHTLNCYLTTQGGLPAIVGGTPGGDFQPQCNLQILSDLLDFGMDPQEAVEAPRWWSFPGTDPASLDTPPELRLEPNMPEGTARTLEALGHRVARRSPGVTDGRVQLITIDPQRGVLAGASDPRGDGHAAAW